MGVEPWMSILEIFDNDGTICDSQEVEGFCYARAIERVTGRSLGTLDWATYAEPTSSAIVLDLLAGDPVAETQARAIRDENLRLLQDGRR